MATYNFAITSNPLPAPWGAGGGSPAWAALQAASGECRTGSGSDGDCAMRYTTSSSLRSIVEYRSGTFDGGAAHLDSSGNGYVSTHYSGTTGELYRVTAGANYSLIGADFAVTYTAGDTQELLIDGNDIVELKNGVEVARRTDATFRTGLVPSIFIFTGNLRLDNWSDGVTAVSDAGYTLRRPGPGISPDRMQQFTLQPRAVNLVAVGVTFVAEGYSRSSADVSLMLSWYGAITRPGPGISPDYLQLFRPRQFGLTSAQAVSVTFAADARGQSSGTGALLIASQLLADGRGLSSGSSVLATGVTFTAAGASESAGTGALLTAAQLLADGRGLAAGTGTLRTAVAFAGDGRASSLATAALTAAGQLTASAAGQSSATGVLLTRVTFAAAGVSVSTATASLGGGVQLSASAGSLSAATGALLTAARLLADGRGLSTAGATLIVRDGLRADGTGRSVGTGALRTAVQLTGSAAAVSAASASLNAAGAFEALAAALSSATAELTRRAFVQPSGPGEFDPIEGQFVRRTVPYVSMVAPGPGTLVAAESYGVAIARFAWADDAGHVRTVRTGDHRLGWVRQVFGPRRAIYIDRGLRWIRTGLPVSLYVQGEFWARFAGGALAGDVVYVSVLDGSPISGYAADALPTPWRVATSAFPGELAIITTWELRQ